MARNATFHKANGTLNNAGNPFTFGPIDGDAGGETGWQKVTVKLADADVVTSGNVGIDPGPDYQLAAWTAGDTTGPAATPAAYGAVLTLVNPAIDDDPGVDFWCRAKADAGETAANDTSVPFTLVNTICVAK
jgi:hypothetical protein